MRSEARAAARRQGGPVDGRAAQPGKKDQGQGIGGDARGEAMGEAGSKEGEEVCVSDGIGWVGLVKVKLSRRMGVGQKEKAEGEAFIHNS